jgi:copper chaperone CopZ/YHS domain-containing protein
MEIELEAAFATRQYKGQTVYFCSANCVQQFDAAPARYAAPASATTGIPAPTAGSGPARIALPIAGLQKSGGPALERAISAVPGVSKTSVNVKEGRAFVDYDPSRANVADLLEAMRSAGFTPDGQTLRLKVSGLYCAECVVRIEDALKATPGRQDKTRREDKDELRNVSLWPLAAGYYQHSGVHHLCL